MTTILAVDDSNTMRRVLEITFAGEDFGVVLANGADQALSELRKSRPAIALVDVTLGSLSGYELCQQIKAEQPGTRVVLLSSKQNPYDTGRGAAAGADDHLDKPFDTQVLIEKVKQLSAAPARTLEAVPSTRTLGAPPPKPFEVAAQTPIARIEPSKAPAPTASAPLNGNFGAPTKPPTTSQEVTELDRPAAIRSGATTSMASLESKLSGLGLTRDQVQGVLALSKEVVEQAVWEIVPALAETLIKEEIQRLTR